MAGGLANVFMLGSSVDQGEKGSEEYDDGDNSSQAVEDVQGGEDYADNGECDGRRRKRHAQVGGPRFESYQ